MNPRWVAFAATVAFFLAVAAVVVRQFPSDAHALAVLAVAASAAAVLIAVVPLRSAAPAGPPAGPVAVTPVRDWIGSANLGREEIVRLLDRLDRMSAHPNLAMRTEEEMDRLRRLPRREFLRVVSDRLDEIEGPA